MKTRFGGIWPAMVTPTTQDGKPALTVCEQLVDLFARQRLGGIYLVGSTGQWPLFTLEERKAIAERVVKSAAGRLPVMVHVGAVTTADAIALAEHAAQHRRGRGLGCRPDLLLALARLGVRVLPPHRIRHRSAALRLSPLGRQQTVPSARASTPNASWRSRPSRG